MRVIKRAKLSLTFLVLIGEVLALTACLGSYSGNTSITILLPGTSESRVVVTGTEAATLRYDITLGGPGGTIHRTLSPPSSPRLNVEVLPGDWTVQVKAYNSSDVLRAMNHPVSVTVRSGENTLAKITMITTTEVDTWPLLQTAAENRVTHWDAPGETTPTDREEIIIWKGGDLSLVIASTILIERRVTIIADPPAVITKNAPNNFAFFTLGGSSPGPCLTLGNGLTLKGNINSGNGAPIVDVNSNGILILDGATLKDNTNFANDGGAISTSGSGSGFIMKRGTITGNKSDGTGYGGAIYLGSSSTFTMYGGTIGGAGPGEANTAKWGGGICINAGSNAFTMYGGTISGNTATELGGGVMCQNGDFNLHGGTISGNATTGSSGGGGGVAISTGGNFNMYGGTIGGNTSAKEGGGVLLGGGSFTKSGGIIYGDNNNTHDFTYSPYENTTTLGNTKGHAVYETSGTRYRDSTLGPDDLLNTIDLSGPGFDNWGY
jgi:hypothetical protein